MLRQKCELGLLDPDWSPQAPILAEAEAEEKEEKEGREEAGREEGGGDLRLDDARSRALAGEVARRSIVLLRNEGAVLPLAVGARLAVVGPRANVADAMFGCYSFPRHVGIHHPDVPIGVEVATVLDALREERVGYEVSYAQGCGVRDGEGDDASGGAAEHADRSACGFDVVHRARRAPDRRPGRCGVVGGGVEHGHSCDVVGAAERGTTGSRLRSVPSA